jgi:hypothetical protein
LAERKKGGRAARKPLQKITEGLLTVNMVIIREKERANFPAELHL